MDRNEFKGKYWSLKNYNNCAFQKVGFGFNLMTYDDLFSSFPSLEVYNCVRRSFVYSVPDVRCVCQSLAYIEQFSFLSAMTWQTQIGHHNIQKLRGVYDVDDILKPAVFSQDHLAIGYGLPAVWSFITAVVELAAPRCAHFKPRFGERLHNMELLSFLKLCFFQSLLFLWKKGKIFLVLSSNSHDATSEFQIFQLLR